MDRQTEITLIKELIGLEDRKTTFLDDTIAHSPISRYTSPERFERETAMIFRRKPMVVAHSSELEGENAFLARRFLDLPILLTRDTEGQVRAFLNVCRHRGARLERGEEGCKRVFTCPYHAWSWDNKGALRAVPQEAKGFPDLPRAERGLRRLPCVEAHGFIWIIANPETAEMPDIDQWLGGLGEDFAWMNLANHRIAVLDITEVKANWKVIIEGGLEAYHFRVAHKETIGPYFPDNLFSFQLFPPHLRGVLPRNTLTDLREVPEEEWDIRINANILYTVIPTMQLLSQQDHVMMFAFEPLAVDRTRIRMATLVPRDAPETEEMQAHWQKNQTVTLTALAEDFELGEEIQSGFASRGNPSHLFGRFEGALNRFNLAVEEMLAG